MQETVPLGPGCRSWVTTMSFRKSPFMSPTATATPRKSSAAEKVLASISAVRSKTVPELLMVHMRSADPTS